MQRLLYPFHSSFLSSSVRANVDHFTDVAVYCDDGVFYLHRIVLAASSHLLHQLLLESNSSDLDQSSLVFPGISHNTFRSLLDFIYTGEVSTDHSVVQEVLGLARLLQIKGVVPHVAVVAKPPRPVTLSVKRTDCGLTVAHQPPLQPLNPLRLIRKVINVGGGSGKWSFDAAPSPSAAAAAVASYVRFKRRKAVNDEIESMFNPSVLEDLLNAMMKHKDSWPFDRPITKIEVPDYHKIIKKPMDLGTIRSKIMRMKYSCNQEVMNDILQVFKNCAAYNKEDAAEYVCGVRLEKYFRREARKLGLLNDKDDETAAPSKGTSWSLSDKACESALQSSDYMKLFSSLMPSPPDLKHSPISDTVDWNLLTPTSRGLSSSPSSVAQISPTLINSMETVTSRVINEGPCTFQTLKEDNASHKLFYGLKSDQNKVFTCSFCGAWFPRLQALRRHERKHPKGIQVGPICQTPAGGISLPSRPVMVTTILPLPPLPVPNNDCLEVYNQFIQFQQGQAIVNVSSLLQEKEEVAERKSGEGGEGGRILEGVQGAHEQSAATSPAGARVKNNFVHLDFDGGVNADDVANKSALSLLSQKVMETEI